MSSTQTPEILLIMTVSSMLIATWDVTDMFNSIPQYFALEQCQENPVINTDCVIEAIDITLKNNVPM